jgi:hypothetical protein
VDRSAAFHEQPREAAPRQFCKNGMGVRAALRVGLGSDDLNAQFAQRLAALRCRENKRGDLPRGLGEFRLRTEAQMRVEHHTRGRAVFEARQTAGQLRIVGEYRADADKNRVMARAKQMRETARLIACDPFALAG